MIPKAPGDEVRSGTTVVAGIGRFPASAVGHDAYMNKIAAEAKKFTKTRSEIQESVNRLLKYITWVIVLALPLQIWSQWRAIGDEGWQQVIIRSTGGLVGLVPEGLVLLTSVAFLLAAVLADPPAGARPGTAGRRGPGPGGRRLPGQDRHADGR